MRRVPVFRLFGAGVLLVLAVLVPARARADDEPPWAMRTRLLLTGAEAASDPAGVTFYSAIAVEATASRRIAPRWSVELLLVNASHEVTRETNGVEEPVGSVELLPLTVTVRYGFRPNARMRPYLGAGAGLAVFWEKSGAWDSLDLPVSVAPAVHAGVEVETGSRLFWSVDATSLWVRTDLKDGEAKLASLDVDLLLLSAGLGVRF